MRRKCTIESVFKPAATEAGLVRDPPDLSFISTMEFLLPVDAVAGISAAVVVADIEFVFKIPAAADSNIVSHSTSSTLTKRQNLLLEYYVPTVVDVAMSASLLVPQKLWLNLPIVLHSKTSTGNDRIVDTVIVESTAIVKQKPLTTQFYLLLVESPF